MPIIAKIDIKNPGQKTAIVGFSLNGKGVYTKEQVAALIKQANKFSHYIIVLHGDQQQCADWKREHEYSLRDIKKGTTILEWEALKGEEQYQSKFREFCTFYDTPSNSDFRTGIDSTVELYLKRHPEERNNRIEKVKFFILEEMAFLTKLAITNHIDCFIYTEKELPAFYVTKKYFFVGADQNFLQWAELSFGEAKTKKVYTPKSPIPISSVIYNPTAQPNSELTLLQLQLQQLGIQLCGLMMQANLSITQGQIEQLQIFLQKFNDLHIRVCKIIQEISNKKNEGIYFSPQLQQQSQLVMQFSSIFECQHALSSIQTPQKSVSSDYVKSHSISVPTLVADEPNVLPQML